MITDTEFRLMCPRLPSPRRAEILPHLNEAMERFRVNTIFRAAAYISNLLHESRSFESTVESLNYSAERLTQVWPKRFPSLAAASPYAHNPRALAEKVYGGRMGNQTPEDAFNYIGRGGIERTGRKAYQRATDALGVDFINHPELLERPEYYCLSDALFWSDNGLNGLADCLTGRRDASEQKTLTAICRRINGGINGLAERTVLYWRVLAVLQSNPSAVVAAAHLQQAIVANPNIPTLETHSAEQIAAEQANPTALAVVAEVQEQQGATSFIDIAEATPPSVVQATAKPLWSRAGGKAVAASAWALASLKAGDLSWWLMMALVVAAAAYLIVSNRRDLKRWLNIAAHARKGDAVAA